MARLRYRGYRIQSRPYQNHQTRLWTVDFEIHRNGRSKQFSLDERYPTEREADLRCLELGRMVIDGKAGGWSVGSLRPRSRSSRLGEALSLSSGGVWRTLLDLAVLVVIVVGAIMLLRGDYLTR